MSEIQEPVTPAQPSPEGTTPNPADVVENSKIPEKFLDEAGNPDPHKMFESYKEIEKGFHQKSEELSKFKKEPPKVDDTTDKQKQEQKEAQTTPEAEVKKTAEGYKLDYEAFKEDYYKNSGKLSDEMREQALKAGVPEEFIDSTIERFQDKAKKEYAQVAEVVGGQEELDTVFEWVTTHYSEEDIKELNEDFKKGISLKTAKKIVKGLQEEMLASEGKAPEFINETSGGSSSDTNIFKSEAQAQAYLSDERANTKSSKYDPAYMKEFREILSRSKKAGYIH